MLVLNNIADDSGESNLFLAYNKLIIDDVLSNIVKKSCEIIISHKKSYKVMKSHKKGFVLSFGTCISFEEKAMNFMDVCAVAFP